MQITDAQTKQFREQGYLALPQFFDADEIKALQAEIARLQRVGLLRNVATEGDGKTPATTRQNLQLCPMSPHSELLRALPFAPKVVEAIRQLIGDPVVLHLDQVFLKPAQHGSGTNWHQDNAYFQIENPLFGTAMWIAVHDANVANGTIHVIPGSHRTQYLHRRDPDSDHHIRCDPPEESAVALELPAGGVAFFAYGTAHCTLANTTDRERAGAAFHFLNQQAIPSPDYFGAQGSMKHPVLSGSAHSDGTAEYGERIAGTWEQTVAQTLANETLLG